MTNSHTPKILSDASIRKFLELALSWWEIEVS